MFFSSAFLLVGLGVVFLCWLGTFVLQIFLSKADNPWLGLILPGITFGLILYICTWAPDFDTIWYGLSRGNIPTVIYLLTYSLFAKERKSGEAGVAYAYLGHAVWEWSCNWKEALEHRSRTG